MHTLNVLTFEFDQLNTFLEGGDRGGSAGGGQGNRRTDGGARHEDRLARLLADLPGTVC